MANRLRHFSHFNNVTSPSTCIMACRLSASHRLKSSEHFSQRYLVVPVCKFSCLRWSLDCLNALGQKEHLKGRSPRMRYHRDLLLDYEVDRDMDLAIYWAISISYVYTTNSLLKCLRHKVFYLIQTKINFVPHLSQIELQFIVRHWHDVSTSNVYSHNR